MLYAERPARWSAQFLTDLLVLAWCVAWVALALLVRDLVRKLDTPGHLMQRAGDGVTGRANDAASGVSGLPLVGSPLRDAFHRLGGAGHDLAAAGQAQATFSDRLAVVLALALAVPPVLLVVLLWLWRRIRWGRAATAARRLRAAEGGADLLALRALATRPLPALWRVTPDPLAAWRAADPETTAKLAAVELRALGLRGPAPSG